MTKYEVLKTFVDSASGERKVPGDKVYGTVEADEHRAADLARNGLIKLTKAQAKAAPADTGKSEEELAAEQQRQADEARLAAYKKAGGWYHFGEGEDVVKVQGFDAALKHLDSLGAADATGNSASGQ